MGYCDLFLALRSHSPANVATAFLDVDKIEQCKDFLLLYLSH